MFFQNSEIKIAWPIKSTKQESDLPRDSKESATFHESFWSKSKSKAGGGAKSKN